jgi:hypothetical protein
VTFTNQKSIKSTKKEGGFGEKGEEMKTKRA